ncbi:hypothetical protein [Saccharophagus degradans]|uniref:Cupin 2, conserved barrel n=1 Tax=Saccharophagus degradans TaxID=86304 RepID=A0AAW7X2L7_9GAMM|nr:hypothetical protein [Saccharophagus degradans]MDO6420856.1 hypothetical protein [Saccharophagus degradans]MDO6609705.1 hypothetical protein [Saccharophagus degradans]
MDFITKACMEFVLSEKLEAVEDEYGRTLDSSELVDFFIQHDISENLPAENIAKILHDKKYQGAGKEILQKVYSDDSIFPDDFQIKMEKKNIKVRGQVWVVHLSDADPFPSSPHAHNYDENVVMHLGNGKLYRKRKYVGKSKTKHFLELRGKINHVELPPLEIEP